MRCKKRPLSYAFTTPISLLLGPGACHHPSPVFPHSVTDPSLYSPHNASPPLVRSMDVLARPYAPPLPSRFKTGPLFGSLTHTHTLTVSPGTQCTKHTLADTHIQKKWHTRPILHWNAGQRLCHSDNRTTLLHPSLQASTIPARQSDREREKLRSHIIPNVEFMSVSVHSCPTNDIS